MIGWKGAFGIAHYHTQNTLWMMTSIVDCVQQRKQLNVVRFKKFTMLTSHLCKPRNTYQDLCGFDFGLVQVDLGLNMRLLGLLELKVLS